MGEDIPETSVSEATGVTIASGKATGHPYAAAGSMDSEADPASKSRTRRYKCSACYKQYKRKEHLVEHMKRSYHSAHQPRCGVCLKHCVSFESVREHLKGPLAKASCSKIFSDQGCDFCLRIFDSPNSLSDHRETCCLSAPCRPETGTKPCIEPVGHISGSVDRKETGKGAEAVAIGCEIVRGGSDGSVNICARVCLVDEAENIIFDTYIKPEVDVTDYRFEVTGLTEARLRDAPPIKEVKDKILEILYNGESAQNIMLNGGKTRLAVGHNLGCNLDYLRIKYPSHLLRDTAKYRPLMKTNQVSHPLKYLARTYLGYDKKTGQHDPYEDSVSAMRIYKRMRALDHPQGLGIWSNRDSYESWKLEELYEMTPDELYEISKSNYRCWCLDSRPALQLND